MSNNAQFISIMEFGRSNNKRTGKRSMRDIVAEAERLPDNCPHVKLPQAPLLIHGESPLTMSDKLEGIASHARSTNGNKLRLDARILLSGVISYPKRMSEFDEHCLKDPVFKDWLKQSRQFLRDHFGKDFRSAVVHFDEGYPHVHFYCHQGLRNNMTLDLKTIHPGLRVEQQLRQQLKRKPKKTELAQANSLGLKHFQDTFYKQVSVDFEHKRHTIKRERLKQAEFKKQQAAKHELEQRDMKFSALDSKLNEKHVEVNALKTTNKVQQHELSRLQRYAGKLEQSIQFLSKKLGLNTPKNVPSLSPKGP
jgi:hypothetical protein